MSIVLHILCGRELTVRSVLQMLSDVVHQLQKERGRTAIYLYSKGQLFAQEMPLQFVQTDVIIGGTLQAFTSWRAKLNLTLCKKLELTLQELENLSEYRQQIDGRSISVSQSIDHYTHKLIGPLLQIMIQIALELHDSQLRQVSAYNAFLHWKERIGQERAIGARGFVQHSFENREFVERILFLLSEQHSYRNTYLALANNAQIDLMNEVLRGPAYANLHDIHEILRHDPESDALNTLTPNDWFDLATSQIDALHAVEKRLISTLSDRDDQPGMHDNRSVDLPKRGGFYAKYDKLITSLQFFAGLSRAELDTLLEYGSIRRYEKGKLLFLEGEPANRLYIVMDGWIKIYKGTASGEEAIVQMLSAGDAVLESAVLLNSNFNISAQVAENAVLLSFPAPVIREKIRNNSELALNLLEDMSYRSQELIRQIESSRLKSVDERIGWFLLKLQLNQGRVSKHVKLPYDKSLIASYLDMKRETFSRALGRLKKRGIQVDNHIIILPRMDSLCEFCDPDTERFCAANDTPQCPK